jgi:hypothetical protein
VPAPPIAGGAAPAPRSLSPLFQVALATYCFLTLAYSLRLNACRSST